MKLGRSFFSLYFLIIICFGILSYALDHLWARSVEQDVESYTGYKSLLLVLHQQLQMQPAESWPATIESAKRQFQLPLTLQSASNHSQPSPVSQITAESANNITINTVNVAYDDDHVTLALPMSTADVVLTLGPLPSPTRPKTEAIVRVAIMLLLGLVLYFWIRPISRDLDSLDAAVTAFGSGQFDSKVDNAKSALIQPIVKTFNMMAGRINNLIAAHNELTTAVSHELSTPLARSKFALQVLNGASDETTRKRYIDSINTDICELEALVNELLVYASFANEQPNITLQPIDICALVKEQVTTMVTDEVDIELQQSLNGRLVKCDPHFINRAVHNLLANAVKYGDGKIIVKVYLSDDNCCIDVEDNGSGVNEGFKKVIFDAFSRFDESRGKDTGGFGLGLAIVSKIMQWHKGYATVTESALGGAKFTIRWPVRSP